MVQYYDFRLSRGPGYLVDRWLSSVRPLGFEALSLMVQKIQFYMGTSCRGVLGEAKQSNAMLSHRYRKDTHVRVRVLKQVTVEWIRATRRPVSDLSMKQ